MSHQEAENGESWEFSTLCDPEAYSKINKNHQVYNKKMLQAAVNHFGLLEQDDAIVDFGCGTGETASSMSEEQVVSKAKGLRVIGLDVSKPMIDYCKKTYSSNENLQFLQLDCTIEEMVSDFESRWKQRVKLVTAFNVLHWVRDQAKALQFMRNILLPDGNGILLIYLMSGSNNASANIFGRAFESVKREAPPPLSTALKDVEYRAQGWKFDSPIKEEGSVSATAYSRLLTSCGFNVVKCDSMPQTLKASRAVCLGFLNLLIPLYAEETKDCQELFREEYTKRLEQLYQAECDDHDSEGLIEIAGLEGIMVFATT